MNYAEIVTTAANNLRLLDGQGKLGVLDSLSLLDMISELEALTNIVIPTSEIRADVFSTIEGIAQLLTRLSTPG